MSQFPLWVGAVNRRLIGADWLGITSANLDSYCGGTRLDDTLDGTFYWICTDAHTHWFIIDLGATYTITGVRGRSEGSNDPIDVDIYVSDSKEDWGDAVATGISSWQDTKEFVEEQTTEKNGRYIKVVVNTTESSVLQWGDYPYITIFDAYGELYASPAAGGNATFFGCNF